MVYRYYVIAAPSNRAHYHYNHSSLKKGEKMNSTLKSCISVAVSLGILYGIYWVFKSVSYFLFYDSMVRDTITEMVKQSALR